jgi:hypothetical protein
MAAMKNLLLNVAAQILAYCEKYGTTRAKLRFGTAEVEYVLTHRNELEKDGMT